MKKLKITIISHDVSEGGLTRAYVLAQTVLKLGYRVDICGLRFGDDLYAAPPDNISVSWVQGHRIPGIFKKVVALLRRLDGDILYTVKPRLTSYGIALFKKFFRDKPVILDMDDWEMSWCGGDEWRYRPTIRQLCRDMMKSTGALRNPQHPLYLKWMELNVHRADVVTVDTHFLQRRFGGVYLPNGKDTSMFDPSKYDADKSRDKYGLSAYKVIMFPGVPRPHKGLEDLLRAIEDLGRRDVRLVIVGENPYDDYDVKLRKQWKRWIIQLPKMPFKDMPEVVAAAHLVAVPQRKSFSAEAQFPIKLTDGMAMAKPIIATRVGDIPEILENAGYIVDPGRPEQLRTAIEEILNDYNAAIAKGNRARERCRKSYSITAMARIFAGVLDKLGIHEHA